MKTTSKKTKVLGLLLASTLGTVLIATDANAWWRASWHRSYGWHEGWRGYGWHYGWRGYGWHRAFWGYPGVGIGFVGVRPGLYVGKRCVWIPERYSIRWGRWIPGHRACY